MDINFKIVKNKHLHSKRHVLADDLSKILGEPGKFAMYLGITKIYPESDLRALAKYVVSKPDLGVKNRGRYFFGALKRMARISDDELEKNRKGAKLRKKTKK